MLILSDLGSIYHSRPRWLRGSSIRSTAAGNGSSSKPPQFRSGSRHPGHGIHLGFDRHNCFGFQAIRRQPSNKTKAKLVFPGSSNWLCSSTEHFSKVYSKIGQTGHPDCPKVHAALTYPEFLAFRRAANATKTPVRSSVHPPQSLLK